ncbi:hypothetical protein MHY1_01277 [Methylovirgula sp. HY1]|nr:hypothetical protein MHY1_01277 [Methylovirgula sp. HY1]
MVGADMRGLCDADKKGHALGEAKHERSGPFRYGRSLPIFPSTHSVNDAQERRSFQIMRA